MVWRVAISSLLILTLLPSVVAAPVLGALTIESGGTFPAGAQIALTGGAAVVPEGSAPKTAHGHVAVVHVRLYEERSVRAGDIASFVTSSASASTWTLHNVTLSTTRAGMGPSSLALEPGDGGRIVLAPDRAFEVYHAKDRRLSTTGYVAQQASPDQPYFMREYRGSHLYVSAPGAVVGERAGVLFVMGLDLALVADENRTVLWTGVHDEGPAQVRVRWAVLEFEDGDVTLGSPEKSVEAMGTESPGLAWRGRAEVVARSGMLASGRDVYAGAGALSLDGDLTATLRPVADGSTDLRLDAIQGELHEATFASASGATAPRPAGGLPLGALAVLLVGTAIVSTGGAAAVVAYRERRQRPKPVPRARRDLYQDCLDWADFFEHEDDPAAAADCLETARAYAEEDEYGTVLWLATCHDRLGNLEEALAAYEAAMLVAPKGDAEGAFGAAMTAGQLGRDESALTSLRIALMADPTLLETVGDLDGEDDPFARLRGTPEFRRLLKDARGWARDLDE